MATKVLKLCEQRQNFKTYAALLVFSKVKLNKAALQVKWHFPGKIGFAQALININQLVQRGFLHDGEEL